MNLSGLPNFIDCLNIFVESCSDSAFKIIYADIGYLFLTLSKKLTL